MKIVPRAAAIVFFGLALAGAAQAQRPVETSALLNGVIWRGPGATMEDLRGKTVVILNYVTWCPLCNAWSPDLFHQLKQAIQGKPVIVVAVCTDEESVPGPVYVSQRNFVAPNILHAYHPKMNQLIGVPEEDLFAAALIGPDGEVKWKGSAGSYYDAGGEKQYAIGRKINGTDASDLGNFLILSPEMPAEVQVLLWPMEMGQVIPQRNLNQVKSRLSAESRDALEQALQAFLTRQLEQIQQMREREVPQQLAAFERAEMLAKNYGATDQGKRAREIWSAWAQDTDFRREQAAIRAYGRISELVTRSPSTKKITILKSFTDRFEGTYAASMASQRIGREQAERVSSPENASALSE